MAIIGPTAGGEFNIRPWEMEGGTVQPGHTVIAAGGGWRVEYEIGYIDVTGFDVDNDKISGKAARTHGWKLPSLFPDGTFKSFRVAACRRMPTVTGRLTSPSVARRGTVGTAL